jgi:zinc/manganese transport system permease protein
MTITNDGRAIASGPLNGFANMLSHSFINHALVAGTAVAVVCGLAGYFLVLRGQVFAGDAQGHIAYTGAMAALVAGLDPRVGLFAATIIAGVALGVISRRDVDDVAIGSFFSWILGLGALFLAYYTTHGSGNNGTANVNVLFGSIFGINDQARTLAVVVAAALGIVLIAIARPLLFATIDPDIAQTAGVPTRLLSMLFLVIVGVTVAEAAQIIGALVVLGLLAAPAAAAARLTTHPWRGFWLSAILATAAIWIGVTIAYALPALPATFTIMSTAAMIYLIAAVIGARDRQPRNTPAAQQRPKSEERNDAGAAAATPDPNHRPATSSARPAAAQRPLLWCPTTPSGSPSTQRRPDRAGDRVPDPARVRRYENPRNAARRRW